MKNNKRRNSLSRKAGTRRRSSMKRNLLIGAAVIFLALITWLVVHFTAQPEPELIPLNTSIKRSIREKDKIHATRMEQLQQSEQYLQAQVQDFKMQALSAQSDVQQLRQRVKYWTNRTLIIPVTQTDTLQKLKSCDSLQQQVSELITADEYKDSIVNMQVIVYEDLLTAKDSTISAFGEDYICLRLQTDTLLQLNVDLTKEYNKTVRQIRRAKRWNKVKGGIAIMLTAGFAATELYRR